LFRAQEQSADLAGRTARKYLAWSPDLFAWTHKFFSTPIFRPRQCIGCENKCKTQSQS
jgi:hypothetical protein